MSAFFGLVSVFVEIPLLAAIPGIAFLVLYRLRRRMVILITSILWLLYMFYELSIKFGLVCPEGCNIRVDLLLIFPILLFMSALAMVFYFSKRRTPSRIAD